MGKVAAANFNERCFGLFYIEDGCIYSSFKSQHWHVGKWPVSVSRQLGNGVHNNASLGVLNRYQQTWNIFWIANDGNVYTAEWRENLGGWHYSARINTDASRAHPEAKLVVLSRKPGIIDVFWVGLDGGIWNNYYFEGQTNSWPEHCRRITPVDHVVNSQTNLIATARGGEVIDVVWVHGANLYSTFWTESQAHEQWDRSHFYALPNITLTNPHTALAMTSCCANSFDLFWVDNYSIFHYSNHYENGEWKPRHEALITDLRLINNNTPLSCTHTATADSANLYLSWIDTEGAIYRYSIEHKDQASWTKKKVTQNGIANPNSDFTSVISNSINGVALNTLWLERGASRWQFKTYFSQTVLTHKTWVSWTFEKINSARIAQHLFAVSKACLPRVAIRTAAGYTIVPIAGLADSLTKQTWIKQAVETAVNITSAAAAPAESFFSLVISVVAGKIIQTYTRDDDKINQFCLRFGITDVARQAEIAQLIENFMQVLTIASIDLSKKSPAVQHTLRGLNTVAPTSITKPINQLVKIVNDKVEKGSNAAVEKVGVDTDVPFLAPPERKQELKDLYAKQNENQRAITALVAAQKSAEALLDKVNQEQKALDTLQDKINAVGNINLKDWVKLARAAEQYCPQKQNDPNYKKNKGCKRFWAEFLAEHLDKNLGLRDLANVINITPEKIAADIENALNLCHGEEAHTRIMEEQLDKFRRLFIGQLQRCISREQSGLSTLKQTNHTAHIVLEQARQAQAQTQTAYQEKKMTFWLTPIL